MKKSLLALAVLGAFAAGAQAQTTNVSIGGVFQANYKSYKASGATTARTTERENRIDDDFNSRFWLTGSEDLGGGLSAIFYVENRFNTDQQAATATGNGLGNGDTWVGLKGSWGQVTVGKHTWMSAQGLITEMQAGNGSLMAIPTSMLATYTLHNQAGGYLDVTRRANSITYRSPNFSGFSGTVGISTASAGNEGQTVAGGNTYSDGREYYLQGAYANGPLFLNLAYRNHNVEGRTGTDNRQIRASGSYKFGAIKVGLNIDRATNKTVAAGVQTASVSRTAWSLPISYGFGNNTVAFIYGRAGNLGGTANTGAHMWTLGWDYALSKRTNVGVYYSRLDNKSAATYQPFLAATSFTGSALTAGENASTFAVGLKHNF